MSLTKKFASCRFSLALAMYAIAAMLIARETVVMQSLFLSLTTQPVYGDTDIAPRPDGRPIERYRKVGPFDMNDPEGSRDRNAQLPASLT